MFQKSGFYSPVEGQVVEMFHYLRGVWDTSIQHGGLVGGWTNPIEKYARQNWNLPEIRVNIANVWNHHLDKYQPLQSTLLIPQVGMKTKNVWVATTSLSYSNHRGAKFLHGCFFMLLEIPCEDTPDFGWRLKQIQPSGCFRFRKHQPRITFNLKPHQLGPSIFLEGQPLAHPKPWYQSRFGLPFGFSFFF